MSTEELNAVGTLIIAGFTVIYTTGTFLLLWANVKTIRLLNQQIKSQIAFNQSSAFHRVLDAHRELFFEVIKDKELRSLFAKESGLGEGVVQSQFLASLLINQACRIFIDYHHNLSDKEDMESFLRDAKDLFSMPFIKERWREVGQFHPKPFVDFVEKQILS